MISGINSWAQGIIVAVVIGTIIQIILPDGKNKKYVKSVIGIYILFSIISPVIGKNIDFDSNTINNYLNINDVKKIEKNKNESVNKTFEEKVIQSIKEKLNNEDLDSNSIKITFDKEYNIGSISIKNIKNINKKIVNEVNIGNSKKEESTKVLSQEKKNDLIDYFSKTYNVSKSKVTLD